MNSSKKILSSLAVLSAVTFSSALVADETKKPDWATGRTLGFAFTYFWYDMRETPEDCPEGYAMALRDVAIMGFPKEEQERLKRVENRSTYYKYGYALSAKRMRELGGKSVCDNTEKFQDPPHRLISSDYAFGMNLDGEVSDGKASSPKTCPQPDFTSPDGTPGIDNQLYRVMGCIDSFRRDPIFAGGAMEDYHVGSYRDGEVTTLLEIKNVDDRMNDDDVDVSVYSSHEPTLFDSQKQGIANASLTVSDNTLWHNHTKGKIVDGELIVEPFDLRLKFGFSGRPAEYYIKDTHIKLKLNEDGTAEGKLAGYYDVMHAYWHNFHNASGAFEVANGFTCPAVFKALKENADAYPDPETGECTAISTAMKIEAVPAFVIHRPESELKFEYVDRNKRFGLGSQAAKEATKELVREPSAD